jgi:hypothetical protein
MSRSGPRAPCCGFRSIASQVFCLSLFEHVVAEEPHRMREVGHMRASQEPAWKLVLLGDHLNRDYECFPAFLDPGAREENGPPETGQLFVDSKLRPPGEYSKIIVH